MNASSTAQLPHQRKSSQAGEANQHESNRGIGIENSRPEGLGQKQLKSVAQHGSSSPGSLPAKGVIQQKRAILQGKTNSAIHVEPKAPVSVSGPPIQRVDVAVGFDGDDNQSMFAGPGDVLRTAGVANCIAIVAYDTGGAGAVMRHYDTVHMATGEMTEDEVSGGNALEFDSAPLAAVKTAMDQQLNQNCDPAGIAYAISAGGVWFDVDPETARWQTRMNLILAIMEVFGVEPSRAGLTASFDVDTQTLDG